MTAKEGTEAKEGRKDRRKKGRRVNEGMKAKEGRNEVRKGGRQRRRPTCTPPPVPAPRMMGPVPEEAEDPDREGFGDTDTVPGGREGRKGQKKDDIYTKYIYIHRYMYIDTYI
jgi:hypothetical protein